MDDFPRLAVFRSFGPDSTHRDVIEQLLADGWTRCGEGDWASAFAAPDADVVVRVHAAASRDLPWCGPLDDNPSNVMRRIDGALVLTDPYYADGPNLYAAAEHDPDRVVADIPEHRRRYMTEIPLAQSGPWERAAREAVREQLRLSDERRATHRAR